MKNKCFIYILLVVISFFMFNSGVEAVEKNLGRDRSCDKVNVTYIASESGYDLNCLYSKTEMGRCVILQLSFDNNGNLAKTTSNVENWDNILNGNSNYVFGTTFKYITDEKLKELTSDKAKLTSCPNVYIYTKTSVPPRDFGPTKYEYRFAFKSKGAVYTYTKMAKIDSNEASSKENNIVNENEQYKNMSCEERLGGKDGDLIKTLQAIVDIVKVFVPILLIVFGILDFAKAIFSFDEGNMKKAQTKFMQRIIVAIAFFLVPTFLGVILDIANKIWPVIGDSFCGIEL